MPGDEFTLSLADDTRLTLYAGDVTAARVVAFLAKAARLSALSPASKGKGTGNSRVGASAASRRVLVVTARRSTSSHPATEAAAANYHDVVCVLESANAPQHPRRRPRAAARAACLTEEQWLWQQLVRLSACIARETQSRGGFLVHSALAVVPIPYPLPLVLKGKGIGDRDQWDEGVGVLLAGRSGVGKSTASRRLPSPWRALSDDVTLIVRDAAGSYWAHPWPTWSRFFGEEAGDGSDTWDVQRAAPLRAIFVLEQGEVDRTEPIGPGHAAALLAELAQQTSTHFLRNKPLVEIAAFNLQRFENICALARALPAYRLDVSLNGSFWAEIARTLAAPPLL